MLVYLNFRIFELYKFHLNGMILELITGGALQDILSFNALVWVLFFSIAIAVIAIQLFIAKLLYSYSLKNRLRGITTLSILLLFFVSSVTSQSIYIFSDAKGDTTITSIKRFIPWAQTITAKRRLRQLGVEVTEQKEHKLSNKISGLDYPKSSLLCEAKRPPNVLMIVVDSLRWDMLDPEIMPQTWSLAEKSHNFTEHYALANSTRFGLFALMYGLPGNYWHSMLNSQTSSAFIDIFLEKGYEFYIDAAAPLYSPEFDRTIFTKVKDKIEVGPKNTSSFKKDQHITQSAINKLKRHNPEKAFFSFVFYDSPHSYSYPKTWPEKFTPSWDKINYLELSNNFDPTRFFNRYKNSVAFTDSLIGELINALEKSPMADNTVVVFTSDHGQEFNETKGNFWGHNGNFSKYQTQVPMIIYWPNSHPLHGKRVLPEQTASIDIVPSLLSEGLGCSNPVSDYSSGLNVYGEDINFDRPLLMESWSRRAIVGEDYIYVSHDTSGSETFNRDYEAQPNTSIPQEDINIIFQEMSRFTK